VLICNAGRGQCGYVEDIPSQDVNTLVQTNLLGSLHAVHAALPFLKQQSSSNHPVSIVIMGSLASLVPLYANSVYTSTKYALKGLAESLKLELIPFGIRVTLLCPGFVDTPLADEISKSHCLK
jgi:3-dehydrosphinganine reductase